MPVQIYCRLLTIRQAGLMFVGSGSFIHPSVHLIGKNNIRIGMNTCVSEHSWLNVNHRVSDKISIEIGNNCFIGKRNFFTSGDFISIGDYTLTTVDCKFLGSSHNIGNPEEPYLISGTTNQDQIRIGVNCFLGAGSTILGNVKVGHGSIIGAGSLVLSDMPPFSLVTGNPSKVVKRFCFTKKLWMPVCEITKEDEDAMPNEKDYLEGLRGRYSSVKMPWIAAGKSLGNL